MNSLNEMCPSYFSIINLDLIVHFPSNPIIVKNIENEGCEFWGITVWKELAINILEFVQFKFAAGTITDKILQNELKMLFSHPYSTYFVPFPQFLPCKISFLFQFGQIVRCQFFAGLFSLFLSHLLSICRILATAHLCSSTAQIPVGQIIFAGPCPPPISTEFTVIFAHLFGMRKLKRPKMGEWREENANKNGKLNLHEFWLA